jgi:biopolymer transport protein ExbB
MARAKSWSRGWGAWASLGLLLPFALGPVAAWGQELPAGAPMEAAELVGEGGLLTVPVLMDRMGWLFYPLAALSVIAVFLIFLYLLIIRRGAVVSDRFMDQADALIRRQDFAGLLSVCNRRGESIARITQKTLDFAIKNPTASFEEVREVTESEGSRQASLLNQRITYLADIGAIAPMVGLLGTVIGMILAFDAMASEAVGAQQQLLAKHVSMALFTTAAGLVIGIVSLMFYSIFRGKVQRLISEMEAASTHLMALLAAQYKRASRAAAARAAGGRGGAEPGPGAGAGLGG